MRRLLVPTLLACACGGTRPIPVELQLTFGGKPCADAGVVSVQVDVEGKVLAPNQFACTAGTTPSTTIALGQFAPGNYSVTVIGFDELGNIPYRVTQAMEVRSGSTKAFLVAAPPPGTLSLRWGLLCFRQSMTVRATVDGHLFVHAQKNPDLPCDDRNRATIGPVASGSRRLTLVARNKFTPCFEAAQCFDFIANLDVTVAAGQDTVVDVTDWTQTRLNSASAHLRWSFEPPIGGACWNVRRLHSLHRARRRSSQRGDHHASPGWAAHVQHRRLQRSRRRRAVHPLLHANAGAGHVLRAVDDGGGRHGAVWHVPFVLTAALEARTAGAATIDQGPRCATRSLHPATAALATGR
jgi:hypothetical protein